MNAKLFARVLVLLAGIICIAGCGGEPQATQSKEEMRQQQLERAKRMEQEAGR
jgi:hypothetical protein